MKRLAVLVPIALVVGLVAAPSALAASPHFKKGGTPVCTITGSGASRTVSCTGTLTGLGNEDLLIETTVAGFAVYQCRNQGGNTAPGQNKVLEGPVTTPTTVPAGAIKNGNVTFTAGGSLTADPTVSSAEAGCPNDNWTGVNPTLTITSVMLEISQGGTFIYCGVVSDPAGLTGTVRFPARSNCG
jgi:hypothetical protein